MGRKLNGKENLLMSVTIVVWIMVYMAWTL